VISLALPRWLLLPRPCRQSATMTPDAPIPDLPARLRQDIGLAADTAAPADARALATDLQLKGHLP
jgi:hypothetical protein